MKIARERYDTQTKFHVPTRPGNIESEVMRIQREERIIKSYGIKYSGAITAAVAVMLIERGESKGERICNKCKKIIKDEGYPRCNQCRTNNSYKTKEPKNEQRETTEKSAKKQEVDKRRS